MVLKVLKALYHHRLAGEPLQAPEVAGEGVDAVHLAFHNERDDGHRTVVEGESLPTEYDIGISGQQFVDRGRHFAVANEYGYRSYLLLHQVLGFWIRLWFSGQRYTLFPIWQKKTFFYYSPPPSSVNLKP